MTSTRHDARNSTAKPSRTPLRGGSSIPRRRFPIGVELIEQGAHARVWAPGRRRVELVVQPGGIAVDLHKEPGGYFSAAVEGLEAGDRYAFRLDGREKLYPDPASRFQPDGPHGPSQVIDPVFAWTDVHWNGVGPKGQVVYELHLGTFTQEGTYAAAASRFSSLRDLGVTVLEIMPIHEFPGRFGWGYDGVNHCAPSQLYGCPDDLRRLVEHAHNLGMGVILDVVYNHLGPDGNYLKEFSADYFTDRYSNEWGESLNFDGENCPSVREFFVENAGYWIDEFHFDGLRLDATQSICDGSTEHILAAIGARVRKAAGHRGTYIVAENEPQEARLVRAEEDDGYGLDALWNDDFHHSALVALTGRREAYYSDYAGAPQELLSAIRWGTLYQGQRSSWQRQPRGTPALDLNAEQFVLYLENHDQVANSAHGARLPSRVEGPRLRAMTALWLLAPGTPMFFQGQEFGSTRPFLYFADHAAELSECVAAGRRRFLAQFPSLASSAMQGGLADPGAEATFLASKLDWCEREANEAIVRLHRDLLTLRREDPAFAQQRADRVMGAVLGPSALVLRYLCPAGDRLLVVNLGVDIRPQAMPEPLLAPLARHGWRVAWSSEDPCYGGSGTPTVHGPQGMHFPGHCAMVFVPEPVPRGQAEEPS